ncbi:MAG: hypothetical protein ACI36X_03410 [Bacteroidaceae bacterium]
MEQDKLQPSASASIRMVGVSRGNEFSPNHVGNDEAIFRLVCEQLRRRGFRVEAYAERVFVEQGIEADVVFSMARDKATLERLKRLEQGGALVVNSAYGVENCVRRPMTERLLAHGIAHPASVVLDLSEPDEQTADRLAGALQAQGVAAFPCWIKRGDSHALVKEDVSFASDRQEALTILSGFRQRGIPHAVVNAHLPGDLVKFYGVEGTDFFYWFYPSPRTHTKFGLEAINGEARGYAFDVEALQRECHRAARILRVPIYGGDCVVSARGEYKIIDFNDWPSFARCREEAGPQIAACIARLANQKTES